MSAVFRPLPSVHRQGGFWRVSLDEAFQAHLGLRLREAEVRKAVKRLGGRWSEPLAGEQQVAWFTPDLPMPRLEQLLAKIAFRPLSGRHVNAVLAIENRERLRWTKDGRLPSLRQDSIRKGQIISIPTYEPHIIQSVTLVDIAYWRMMDAT